MNGQKNIRNIVLNMLTDTLDRGRFSHVVLNETLASASFDPVERRFLSVLFSGTLEQLLYLDHVIGNVSKTRPEKMKPVIRNLLRMTVYQMLFLDAVPDRAAVSEALKLCRKRNLDGLKPFVNGVLRTIGREKETIKKEKDSLPLYLQYSVPDWICRMAEETYGKEALLAYLGSCNRKSRPTTVRLVSKRNREKREEIIRSLVEDGCDVACVEGMPDAVSVSGFSSFTELEAYKKGWIFAQDLSSMLVAEAVNDADLPAGKRMEKPLILDVCAAPGGKSLALSDRFPEVRITACDLSEKKAALIRENAERLRADNVTVSVHDARIVNPRYRDKADVVICDLPCSGLGVIGRKPDIRFRLQPEDIRSLAQLQREILQASAACVRPGGVLLYSTCTITETENAENACWLQEQFAFELQPLTGLPEALLTGRQKESCKKGSLQLLNGINETDGFFICKFRRKQ